MASKEQKVKMLKWMTDELQKQLLERVDEMPDEWEGSELWCLMADWANAMAGNALSNSRKRRLKYNNFSMITSWMPSPRR